MASASAWQLCTDAWSFRLSYSEDEDPLVAKGQRLFGNRRYAERKASRAQEAVAIGETIKILNDDDA